MKYEEVARTLEDMAHEVPNGYEYKNQLMRAILFQTAAIFEKGTEQGID